ncbi:MAG: hypothetical protein KU38_03315 [Sulfurovum sp. FS08-3]|nr:MAG: hypothetical protein KU38_03315 [Sulfurovum sp. FS08-3]
MQIVRSRGYLLDLQEIMEYIAKDSLEQAFKFEMDLDSKINKLDYMPYKCRKSIYFDDKNIRDLIFKGYVVTYRIESDKIMVIAIIKYRNYREES